MTANVWGGESLIHVLHLVYMCTENRAGWGVRCVTNWALVVGFENAWIASCLSTSCCFTHVTARQKLRFCHFVALLYLPASYLKTHMMSGGGKFTSVGAHTVCEWRVCQQLVCLSARTTHHPHTHPCAPYHTHTPFVLAPVVGALCQPALDYQLVGVVVGPGRGAETRGPFRRCIQHAQDLRGKNVQNQEGGAALVGVR